MLIFFYYYLETLNTFISITKVEILDRYNMENLKIDLNNTPKIMDFLKVFLATTQTEVLFNALSNCMK